MSEEANVLDPIEELVAMVPGASTPLGRVAVFGAAGTAVAYFLRPEMSFNPDGSAKPWIILDPNNANATLFPYWAYTLVPAVLFGIFL